MSSGRFANAEDDGMLAGIFVGGQSTRMGGRPKGLLRARSGETLVERWSSIFAALSIPTVLVGQNPAYARLGIEQLEDAAPNIGPLGGLLALLERAKSGFAIAVACDMPFVSLTLVERLARHSSAAAAVAPRADGVWQTLFSRFRVAAALPPTREQVLRKVHSMQRLFDTLDATPFELNTSERAELIDWDTPGDIERGE
jgi:molybdopterin-guanine dinucleotide biosynthesis protein A